MDTGEKIATIVFFIIFGIICLFVVAAMFISHIGPTNGGQHTGYITSVEQEGWIFKTWRAYVKTDPQSSQEDHYCVTDDSLVSELKERAKDRKLVTIDYSAPFIVWSTQCGKEPSIINSIEK